MREPGLYWVRCQDAKHEHHMMDCACISMRGWTIVYVTAVQDIYEFGYDQVSYDPAHPLSDSEWGPRLQLPEELRMRDQETSARYKAACRVIKDAVYLSDLELRRRGHDGQAIMDAHLIGHDEDRCWDPWSETTASSGAQ